MIKGICQDCVFSEDLSVGSGASELTLWICWAKRVEYSEPPNVCAQYNPRGQAAKPGTTASHAAPRSETPAVAAALSPEIARKIAAHDTPSHAAPPAKPITGQPAAAPVAARVTEQIPPEPAPEIAPPNELPFLEAEELPTKTADGRTDPRSGHVLSLSDEPRRRFSGGLLIFLMFFVVMLSGIAFFFFFEPGDNPLQRWLHGGTDVPRSPATSTIANSPVPKPATSPAIARPVRPPEGLVAAALPATAATAAVVPPPPPARPATATPVAQAAAAPTPGAARIFIGPVHQTPSFILVDSITPTKEAALARYNSLKRRGFLCGYLWIPDYPSLSGVPRWMAFIGPFPTLEEAKWRLDIYKGRVKPSAFGRRLDLEPLREKF